MGVDIYGVSAKKEAGQYFAANWWSWRPIALLITVLNVEYEIGIPDEELLYLDTNSSRGITSPKHCTRLSELIDEYVGYMKLMNYDRVYLNLHNWYSADNVRASENVMAKLKDAVPYGLLFVLPVIDGVTYKPSHSTSIKSVQCFAEFLKNCNGFKVN
jgi:hypothetical protein